MPVRCGAVPASACQVISRQFSYGDMVMLPVIDQTNHDITCPHAHPLEPCDPVKGLQQWKHDLPSPSVPPTLGAGLPVRGSGGDTTAAGSGASGVCITWRAGTTLTKGQEVCNYYKMMTNDRSEGAHCTVCCRFGGSSHARRSYRDEERNFELLAGSHVGGSVLACDRG